MLPPPPARHNAEDSGRAVCLPAADKMYAWRAIDATHAVRATACRIGGTHSRVEREKASTLQVQGDIDD
jgi:hypothetical protein